MNPETTRNTSLRFKFVPELDGLRAIAVSLVFISHAGLEYVVPGGFGVNIFFFLSGYLITSLMRDEFQTHGTVSLKNFYIRRSLRILPPMWIAMALAAGLALTGAIYNNMTGMAVAAQAMFLINYADFWGSTKGVPGIPLWSLAVEEHFYLLFPAVYILFLARRPGRETALILLIACAAFLLLRCVEYAMISNHEFMYYRSHLRMDSILFGSVLAVWQNPILDGARAWRPGWASFVLALALLVFTLAYRDPAFREILRYSVQGIGLFVVYSFILARKSFMNTILKLPPFQLIGRYSYAIYLVHVPILFMVEQNLTSTHALWRGLLAAFLTLVISGLIHVLVEKPAARLRHAFSSAATPGEKPAPLQAAT